MRSVHFYRDYSRFSGGHLKLWHYFNHVLSSRRHKPRIRFTQESVWDASNPWHSVDPRLLLREGDKLSPDVIFLAGLDWMQLSPELRERPGRPIFNLVQHVRHADENDELHAFLKHGAIRICVSPEVAQAIEATGLVRGPIFTINNGIDLENLPASKPSEERSLELLVLAIKNPGLGRSLYARLWRPWRRSRLITRPLPREELLATIADSRRVLLLPDPREGFYLPALEAMALGALVVVPDCVGNRGFCLDKHNCLRPAHDPRALLEAFKASRRMPPAQVESLLRNARETAAQHGLERERREFLELLENCEELAKSYA